MSARDKALAALALSGGPKLREEPFPARAHVGAEEKAAVDALFDKAMQTGVAPAYGGEEEEAYCREFAQALGGGYADAVSSGTAAVYVALKALEIEPFTEVVVSPITDPGGIMPIPLLGCIPVPADAAPGCYNTGPDQVAARITERTSAILLAHIGGEPADIEGILQVAQARGVPVVEDCAQAHGARLGGRPLGTFSPVSAFSTMHGKHHCTGGQGGVVFTQNEDLYWRARRAADRGKPLGLPPGSTNVVASLNFNSTEFAAAIGRVQLRKLPGIVDRRRAVVARLREELRACASLRLPEPIPGAEPSWWWWRLGVNDEALTCDKATFTAALEAEGLRLQGEYGAALVDRHTWLRERRALGTGHFPWTAAEYRGDPQAEYPLPNAHEAIAQHFNLTVYETWGEREVADIKAIVDKVEAAYLR